MNAGPRFRRTALVSLGILVVLGIAGMALPATAKAGFALQISPASQSVPQGQSAGYTVTTTATGGFTGSVSYSVSGLPKGVTGAFSPTSATLSSGTPSRSSVLSVTTSPVRRWAPTPRPSPARAVAGRVP